jgi:ferrous iron transport protein B
VTVVIVDATRLERNLNLALQILEITDRVVVALNLIDEAERHGITIDERHLARELGVPVVPMVARRGQGIPELLGAIEQVATGSYPVRAHRIAFQQAQSDAKLEKAINTLAGRIEAEFPGLPNARWVALRLLEGDASIEQAVRDHSLGDLSVKGSAEPVAMTEALGVAK